jgi:hypothetical protein
VSELRVHSSKFHSFVWSIDIHSDSKLFESKNDELLIYYAKKALLYDKNKLNEPISLQNQNVNVLQVKSF